MPSSRDDRLNPAASTTAARGVPSADVGARLRIALLTYRGNPYCGGQGVYVRHLSRALGELGHHVTVFSGQPYPEVDGGVALVRLPSLDLYRAADPFRVPRRRELMSPIDLLELMAMFSGALGEPRTFSLRARDALRARRGEFDVVHDNQCLGTGMLDMVEDGWPMLTSIHHPVAIDRALELAATTNLGRRLAMRRWYGFVRMQARVARRVGRILTVSESSCRDIVEKLGIPADRIAVVPVGVDPTIHRPLEGIGRVPGRIMATASADVAMKGLTVLLEALAKLRTEVPDADLVVIGRVRPTSPVRTTLERLGLEPAVEFVTAASDDEIVRRYASSSCAVVPSLYEGFSLPAIEALACGVPLVATQGGALPEVLGGDGALLVPPGDAAAMSEAIKRLLVDDRLAERLANAGRRRVLERFTWRATAVATVAEYRRVLAEHGRC